MRAGQKGTLIGVLYLTFVPAGDFQNTGETPGLLFDTKPAWKHPPEPPGPLTVCHNVAAISQPDAPSTLISLLGDLRPNNAGIPMACNSEGTETATLDERGVNYCPSNRQAPRSLDDHPFDGATLH